MSLLDVRLQFREVTGRADLVNEDGTDNGADYYINAGQRYLDRKAENQKSVARYFVKPALNANLATFVDCRSIKEVWISNGTTRVQLTTKTIQELRELYPEIAQTSGQPLYYSPAYLRITPEFDRIDTAAFTTAYGAQDVLLTTHYKYNGVLFYPPSDGTWIMEVWGYFYSPKLEEDADESYWTEMHPEVLVMGAAYMLEAMNRNTQGMKDWDGAISTHLSGIEMDMIEEDVTSWSEMEG
jgi:hypothetical protein